MQDKRQRVDEVETVADESEAKVASPNAPNTDKIHNLQIYIRVAEVEALRLAENLVLFAHDARYGDERADDDILQDGPLENAVLV